MSTGRTDSTYQSCWAESGVGQINHFSSGKEQRGEEAKQGGRVIIKD